MTKNEFLNYLDGIIVSYSSLDLHHLAKAIKEVRQVAEDIEVEDYGDYQIHFEPDPDFFNDPIGTLVTGPTSYPHPNDWEIVPESKNPHNFTVIKGGKKSD